MTDREPFARAELWEATDYVVTFPGWDKIKSIYTKKEAEEVSGAINAAFNKRLDEEIAKVERLRFVLKELHALVWGEAPSLLCEDSGGDALLDCKILEVLEP